MKTETGQGSRYQPPTAAEDYFQTIHVPAGPIVVPEDHSTRDEIKFIEDLALRRPVACMRYCSQILFGMRCWDPAVNLGVLKNFAWQKYMQLSNKDKDRPWPKTRAAVA